VIELNPNHQPAMVQMAFEFLKRREYETALPLAEKSVELSAGNVRCSQRLRPGIA
jgi:hypothetical protein